MKKLKRITIVSLLAITVITFSITGLCCLDKGFSLERFITLSLSIESGIIGLMIGGLLFCFAFSWAIDADEKESFIHYTKTAINNLFD